MEKYLLNKLIFMFSKNELFISYEQCLPSVYRIIYVPSYFQLHFCRQNMGKVTFFKLYTCQKGTFLIFTNKTIQF